MTEVEETITLIKPFKLIALILLILGLILLIVGIASPAWLDTDGYKQGLWRECSWGEDIPEECKTLDGDAWVKACGALCIIAMLGTLGSIVLTAFGLCSKSYEVKYWAYKIAMIISVFTVICLVIALIVFPVMFMEEISERQKTKWLFQWAYGVTWGATVFIVGAVVMLCLDKESYERDYVNKYQSDA